MARTGSRRPAGSVRTDASAAREQLCRADSFLLRFTMSMKTPEAEEEAPDMDIILKRQAEQNDDPPPLEDDDDDYTSGDPEWKEALLDFINSKL